MAESASGWGKVANSRLTGSSDLVLDAKGRIAIPARHRDILTAMNVTNLTITKHRQGALMIFPQPAWDAFSARVAALPMEADGWQRFFLGNAVEVELDGSSRVLIAPSLRKFANLEREVTLIGVVSHFELWNTKAYEDHEAEVLKSEMPASLKSFSVQAA